MIVGSGVLAQNVAISVYPRVAVANPYRTQDFRVRWRVKPNEANLRYALSYTCGASESTSEEDLDKDSPKTFEAEVHLTVLENCTFQICVWRIVDGKMKTDCDYAHVEVSDVYP